jgi:hypothetical protein
MVLSLNQISLPSLSMNQRFRQLLSHVPAAGTPRHVRDSAGTSDRADSLKTLMYRYDAVTVKTLCQLMHDAFCYGDTVQR